MTDRNEALRLADDLEEAHRGHADEGPSSFSEAATLLRQQAERIDQLRAEVETLRKLCVEQAQSLIERPVLDMETARTTHKDEG